MKLYQTLFLLLFILPTLSFSLAKERKVVYLNGQWDIAVTGLHAPMPKIFSSRIPVPGLVDMASPVLVKSNKRTDDSLFWYRKTFRIDNENYDIAELNILRARYHTWVYVNGQLAGENPYNFTASAFDIRKYLKKNAEYELIAEIVADGKRIRSFRQIEIKNLKDDIK